MDSIETNENGSTQDTLSGKKDEPLTRDQVLRLSSQTIRALHKRVSGQRFKARASDSGRLSHIRALVAVLQVYGGLLRDHELTELEKRIGELEKLREMRIRL